MNINELVTMLTNRLNFLQSQRTMAVSIGDVLQVGNIDIEIAETQTTLSALQTLG